MSLGPSGASLDPEQAQNFEDVSRVNILIPTCSHLP